LFPQPDSPTIPTISPLFTPKLTPRTTWVVTSSDVKAVFRFLTSNKSDIIRRSFNPLFLDPTHLLIHHQTSLMTTLLKTQRSPGRKYEGIRARYRLLQHSSFLPTLVRLA